MKNVFVIKQLLPKQYVGVALWPFIIVKQSHFKEDTFLMNHERIHLQQQQELLIIPFYVWYLIEWVIRLIQFRNAQREYYNISFEREAFANEMNLAYLEKRSAWSFLKYIF